jgi:23S rRNA-/tRNA-specific pseudouridylate synthase
MIGGGRLDPASPQALDAVVVLRVVCLYASPCCLQAIPEAIPLDVVFEDDHLIVINKVSLLQWANAYGFT